MSEVGQMLLSAGAWLQSSSFSNLGQGLTGFATALLPIVAFLGLNSWRRQKIGERKLQMVEEVLSRSARVYGDCVSARLQLGDEFGRMAEDAIRKNEWKAAGTYLSDGYHPFASTLENGRDDISYLNSNVEVIDVFLGRDFSDNTKALLSLPKMMRGFVSLYSSYKDQFEHISQLSPQVASTFSKFIPCVYGTPEDTWSRAAQTAMHRLSVLSRSAVEGKAPPKKKNKAQAR